MDRESNEINRPEDRAFTNVIKNGDFENSLNDWVVSGPAAGIKIVDNQGSSTGKLAVAFNWNNFDPTLNPNDRTTIHQDFSTTAGKTYAVQFFTGAFSRNSTLLHLLGCELLPLDGAGTIMNQLGYYASFSTRCVAENIRSGTAMFRHRIVFFRAKTDRTRLKFWDLTQNNGVASDLMLDSVSVTEMALLGETDQASVQVWSSPSIES